MRAVSLPIAGRISATRRTSASGGSVPTIETATLVVAAVRTRRIKPHHPWTKDSALFWDMLLNKPFEQIGFFQFTHPEIGPPALLWSVGTVNVLDNISHKNF